MSFTHPKFYEAPMDKPLVTKLLGGHALTPTNDKLLVISTLVVNALFNKDSGCHFLRCRQVSAMTPNSLIGVRQTTNPKQIAVWLQGEQAPIPGDTKEPTTEQVAVVILTRGTICDVPRLQFIGTVFAYCPE